MVFSIANTEVRNLRASINFCINLESSKRDMGAYLENLSDKAHATPWEKKIKDPAKKSCERQESTETPGTGPGLTSPGFEFYIII